MKKAISLLLALAMAISVAACSQPSTDDTGDTGETSEPFVLNVSIASEPATLDPALNSAVDGAVMLNHFFEGLVRLEDDGQGNGAWAPGQAASWDQAEGENGQVIWTFHLRDGIKWSDGSPVTANDFVYAWQRLANPETAADYSYMIDTVVNWNEIQEGTKTPEELGVRAVDDATFEVTLITAVPYFLDIAGFPACYPVQKATIDANGDQWTLKTPAEYVGNGPYKLKEWKHQDYILMEKNPEHWDYANLGPDEIKFYLIDDQNAMLNGFDSGELDYIDDVPINEIPRLLESGALTVVPYIGTYYVEFQTQKAPFDDPKVRQAFTLAIDRNYIVENITQTGQLPASGFVPSGIYDKEGAGSDFREVGGDYYSVEDADYAANCEKARQLLAEAGYEGGAGFPTVEYVYNTSDAHKNIAEALQNMWKTELGVEVTLSNEEWNTFLETRKVGNYSIARAGWIADYNDPATFLDMFVTGGGNNDPQYNNPAYDELVRQFKASSDPSERFTLLHQVEDIVLGEDWIIAPIYFYTELFMAKPELQGVYRTPMGFTIFSYAHM